MPSPASAKSARRALLWLWALSGFSTLTCELVWMREMALWAGSTVTASTLVVAVFFASAAMGNLLGARLMRRDGAPLRWYARFEMLAALLAMLCLLLSRWLWAHSDVLPAGWWLRAGMALLLAGPASFCSGVAFPCLAESFVESSAQRVVSGAPFYALNLLGAACGVTAGGVLLPAWLGTQWTLIMAALVQLCAGALAWRYAAEKASNTMQTTRPGSQKPGWVLLMLSGVLSLATQSLLLLWMRQLFEGSVYAMSAVFAVFIAGLGLGALAASALRKRGQDTKTLLRGFSAFSALGLFVLPWIGGSLSVQELALSAKSTTALLLEALSYAALALPLTFSLGGIFPLAWEMTGVSSSSEGAVLGRALALNKLGSATGVTLGLFLLMPMAGLAWSTLIIGWAYAVISVLVARRSWPWLALVMLPGLTVSLMHYDPPGILPGLRLLDSKCGAYGPVSVVEDPSNHSRQILLNSRQRLSGTQQALASQHHQSWVPLLFCRELHRVCTIGMAAGISADATLDFPIEHLDAVELVPEVVQMAHEHFSPWNARLFTDARSHVLTNDGRQVLARSRERYDAIICDLLFPAEEGTATLYSREFFQLARSRLSEGGVFCTWLPLYQHSAATAEMVIHTFIEVFPNAILVRASFDPLQPAVGLIGSMQKLPLSTQHLQTRIVQTALKDRSPFLRSGLHAQLLLLGDLRNAEPGFDTAPITTDDHARFAFAGPVRPESKERLVGVTFLNWIGRRFPRASFPSCDLADTAPEDLLSAIRAANHYLATAVSMTVLPGDPRPAAVREQQTQQALEHARSLSPQRTLELSDLGR